MYEKDLTRQALPSKYYRELLGTALCVFNSNVAFVIENVLHTDSVKYNWYSLMDLEAGQLSNSIAATISIKAGEDIANTFKAIIEKRNRIIHSFQVTDNGEQRLATKTRIKDGNIQFVITEEFLKDFIKMNEDLCFKLHQYRDNFGIVI